MAYNMYKQIFRVKESLEKKEYKKDIPVDVFRKEMMLIFGMKYRTATEWIDTFEEVDLIEIKKSKEDNTEWIVNFV